MVAGCSAAAPADDVRDFGRWLGADLRQADRHERQHDAKSGDE